MRLLSQILLFVWLCPVWLCGQAYFKITPDIEKAYRNAISLKFQSANELITKIKQEDPNNLMVLHIENYVDFFTIFINEDKKEFERLEKNKKRRLNLIKKKGDQKSPYYRFIQAEINLQWAVARAKFEQFFKASTESFSAYRLLEENQKLFPDFIENKKSLSAIHTVSETLPRLFKFIFSIDGSIEEGTREIEEVIEYMQTNSFLYKEEVGAIYAYILYYQNNKKEQAWQYIKKSHLDPSTNPLSSFLIASMAQKTGRNEEVIAALEQRPKGSEYHDFHYLDFLEGRAKLYKLDPSSKELILSFVQNFKGRHFIKEAYQKLAWYEIIMNEDIAAYKYYMKKCQIEGEDLVDEDKQALKEAKDQSIPNPELLKARILFDGGYYQKAYNLLIKKSYVLASNKTTELEYYYRLGRVTHLLKNYFDALQYYSIAYQKGKESSSFMACNAALQMGLIYENQNDSRKAKKYFDACLDISPKEYKNSLHQKAKSGIARLKN